MMLAPMSDALLADQAPECGSAYYRYGAALFYKAQDEADVFGDNLQGAAEAHDAQVDSDVLWCHTETIQAVSDRTTAKVPAELAVGR